MKATSLPSVAARQPVIQQRRAGDYLKTPQGWLFLLLGAAVLWTLATGERHVPALLDQDNYLEYFKTTTWEWVADLYDHSTSMWSFTVSMVTEEIGWRLWVILNNLIGVTPSIGIRITVVLLNVLVMFSLMHVRRPLIGLILWIVIPTALATVGLFQIRQGFAFAIAMLFTSRFQRPVLGWVLASFIHTTFAVPALILMAIHLCRRSKWFALAGASAMALGLACSAGYLFQNFGGRRIAEYSGYQDDFTIRLVLLLIAYMIPSVILLYSTWKARMSGRMLALTELSMMHIALVLYLVSAYFVFPFGKGRVWYCVPLLLSFLVPEIRFKNPAIWWLTIAVLAVLSADIAKNYSDGVYAYFIG
jgi:hypothetical protein